MKYLLILIVISGCATPRALPSWKAEQMGRRGNMPCSAWSVGQRIGNGQTVTRVARGYVTIRTRTREYINVSCKP
jgi:hypothetical protein